MANNTNWLNISSMSGSSGQTILTLSANRNLSTNYKTAEITAYNPVYNISAKTYVTLESYAPILSISPSIVGIPASGGTYELNISANCAWVIAFPDIVTSYSTSASTGDAVVTFTVPNTICASTLVGNIVVTDESGQVSRICRLEQYGEGVHISFSPSAITLPYYGGSDVFTVTADCVYTVEKGTGDWYSVSSDSGYTGATQFTVSGAATNSGNTDWTDSITIVGPDGVAGTIAVTQLNWGQYHFNYTADTSTIDYSGETRTITIDTTDAINSSITIEIISAPDVTYSYSTSGLSRGIITLNVPQNPGGERHFKVIVTGRRALSQNNSTAVIEYTQEALRLEFTTDTSNVAGTGETRTITILNTNINPNRTGLNLPSDFPQQGSYTVVGNTIYLTYPRNPSSSATRSWTIGVVGQTNDGVSLSGSYQIAQNANPIYSIPYTADTSTVDASGETRTITIDTSNLVASSITVGIEGATGITYTYENGVITVIFPPNTNPERMVTVTVNAETLNGNDATLSVTFDQDGEIIIPTGDSRVVVVYNVTSTTNPTKILNYPSSYNPSAYPFTKAECPDGNEISLYTIRQNNGEYRFNKTGSVVVYYTLRDPSVLNWLGISNGGVFSNCDQITNVLIPDSVTSINPMTCSSCDNLSSVTLSTGLTMIGDYAFYDCPSLSNITLPVGLQDIEVAAFSQCGLTGITIPNTVTHIGSGCFRNCSGLTNVVIGTGLTELGACDTHTEYVENSAIFKDCTGLTAVTILGQVTKIGNACFSGCTSLANIAFLPDSVELIGSEAFKNCVSITNISLPDSTVFLGDRCFENCYALTNITTNNSLEYLGHYPGIDSTDGGTFSGCTGLQTITFPSSLLGLGNNIFANCSGITNMFFEGISAPGFNNNVFGNIQYSYPIIVPCQSVDDYRVAVGQNYANRIQCTALSYTADTSDVASTGETRSIMIDITQIIPSSITVSVEGAPGATYSYNNAVVNVIFPANIGNAREITVVISGVQQNGHSASAIIVYTQNATNTATGMTLILDDVIVNSGEAIVSYSPESAIVSLVYSSTDTNVAVIDQNGNIQVLADGTTTITVVDLNSSLSVTKTITCRHINISANEPLTFQITSNGDIRWTTFYNQRIIQYKKNDGVWTNITSKTGGTAPSISVVEGDIVQFKATGNTNTVYGASFSGSTASFKAMNNIMSLLKSTGFETAVTISSSSALSYVFENTYVTDASDLLLPATTLANECYSGMFKNCSSLTQTPELPATTLKRYCYAYMFSGCTSLVASPELPATGMLYRCYEGMFSNCSSLTQTPELPATTLEESCYEYMFSGCTNLSAITCLATDITATNCTNYWLYNVAAAGTITTPSTTQWATGVNGIPSGWTRVNSDT